MMDRFDVSGAYRYGPKGTQFDSPDVLVRDQGNLVIVAECKATKLTYLAQFAEDPFEAAKRQYAQLAKGIFQLWRFFSHVRRNLVEEALGADCHALVFTLDPFMQMSRDPQNKVLAEANTLADEDGNIAPEDRRPVVICPIYDLEAILSRATEDSLLASLNVSKEAQYQGWMLREVHRHTGAAEEFGKPKRYPFDMADVLPWWTRFRELRGEDTA
jgi:hypothetical protein